MLATLSPICPCTLIPFCDGLFSGADIGATSMAVAKATTPQMFSARSRIADITDCVNLKSKVNCHPCVLGCDTQFACVCCVAVKRRHDKLTDVEMPADLMGA